MIKKLSPYLYRVKTKAAVMVANHDRLKKCVNKDIQLWLSHYREKFRSPMPEGEEVPVSPGKAGGEPAPPLSDSPVSSPSPGTLLEPPRPKRKRGRPRKVPGSSSNSTQSPDLSSDTDVY